MTTHEFVSDWYRPARCVECGLRKEDEVHIMTFVATPRPCEGPEGRKCFFRCPECVDKWFPPNLETIKQAYGFTISNDGEVHGLVAGDMGYESTNIQIPTEDLEAWAYYNYKDAEIERLREELNAYKSREKTPPPENDSKS